MTVQQYQDLGEISQRVIPLVTATDRVEPLPCATEAQARLSCSGPLAFPRTPFPDETRSRQTVKADADTWGCLSNYFSLSLI